MSYHGLPIVPHLLDLLYAIRDDGITLTLAGGLGIYLKRADVVRRIETEALSTLRPSFPEARGTSDMDLFVHLELFADPNKEARLREVLCGELRYEPKTKFWQFEKTVQAGSGGDAIVKIDLMARDPGPADALVKTKDTRVGTTRKRPTGAAVHGRRTPEAFAIDLLPHVLRIDGERSTGEPYSSEIRLPHPFASLVMKLQATLDYPLKADLNSRGYRHAYDVYLLLAMMTEREWEETCRLARETCAHEPVLVALKAVIKDLFGADDARGCLDMRVAHQEAGEVGEIDLPWLRDILALFMG